MPNQSSTTTSNPRTKAGGLTGYLTRAVKRVLRTAMQGARQRFDALRGSVGGSRGHDDTAPRAT